MRIKRYEELNESTSSWYPGLWDDGTADHLASIMKNIYKKYNEELRKSLEKIEGYSENDEKQKFFNKWMMANMVATSLQDGFYMEDDLIEKATELYEEVLSDINLEEYTKDSKDFVKEVSECLEEMKNLTKISGNDYYYSPHFMKEYKS
jgi:predicted S18 family serine protease